MQRRLRLGRVHDPARSFGAVRDGLRRVAVGQHRLQRARLAQQAALQHEVRPAAGATRGVRDAVLEVGVLLAELVGGDEGHAGIGGSGARSLTPPM